MNVYVCVFTIFKNLISFRVCYTSVASSSTASRIAYRIAYRAVYSSYACGFLWLNRCRRSRWINPQSAICGIYSLYNVIHRATSFSQAYTSYYPVVSYSVESRCCSGYAGEPPSCQGTDWIVELIVHTHIWLHVLLIEAIQVSCMHVYSSLFWWLS